MRTVWLNALANHLIDNVPLTHLPLDTQDISPTTIPDPSSLSIPQLERLVLATWRTRESWEAGRLDRTRTTYMRSRVGRVSALHFLKIRSSLGSQEGDVANEGRYLLSFGQVDLPAFCVQIWDVEARGQDGQSTGAGVLAEWTMNGQIIGIITDEGNCVRDWNSSLTSDTRDEAGSLIAVSAKTINR